MNVNAVARMVDIRYPSRTKKSILSKNISWLYDYYIEHSKENRICEWGFTFDTDDLKAFTIKHNVEFEGSIDNYDERRTLCKKIVNDSELSSKYSEEYPEYTSFVITLPLEEYMDLDFEYGDKLGIVVEKRFSISYKQQVLNSNDNLEIALGLIKQNIELFDKQLLSLQELGEHHYNFKCNTSLVDNFLSKVNQTKLLEDACTDMLQSALSDGWRIISVCPQPNQRRPDYILGMVVSADEVTKSAYRY